jgi:hypothetical protein
MTIILSREFLEALDRVGLIVTLALGGIILLVCCLAAVERLRRVRLAWYAEYWNRKRNRRRR